MSVSFIKEIPLNFHINLFQVSIDYKKMSDEILSSDLTRMTDNPTSTFSEDSYFHTPPGSESERFQNIIVNFFKENNYKVLHTWAHVHRPLESTHLHFHGDDTKQLSFVYYAKVNEKSGKLVFNLEKFYHQMFSPKIGNLLVFPSWLPHYVTKNLSNETRISISGNVYPIE